MASISDLRVSETQGLADWSKIRAVKDAVSVPVIANGNILYHEDIQRCLDATGADGVMSAEGNLYNPGIFDEHNPNPSHTDLALEYLDIVSSLKTVTSPGAIRGHLFKLLRPSVSLVQNRDLRDQLGKTYVRPQDGVQKFVDLVMELKERNHVSDWEIHEKEAVLSLLEQMDEVRSQEAGGVHGPAVCLRDDDLQDIPHWLAQPYIRPVVVSVQDLKIKRRVSNLD